MDFGTILRWTWGTLLTAIVTAVLTMFLKHGRRWFRGVRKFIRTGRIGRTRRSAPTGRSAPTRYAPSVAKEPRMTVARVLSMLGQLTGTRGGYADPPQQVRPGGQDDTPLDLRF